ncbi:MAG: hypothetical protein R3C01_13665 [Planctomycetaceae bacterium]
MPMPRLQRVDETVILKTTISDLLQFTGSICFARIPQEISLRGASGAKRRVFRHLCHGCLLRSNNV